MEPIQRELDLPVLAVDHAYHVQTAGREWIAHYEVQTRYKSDVSERMAWYATALALKFRMPVETVLILLVEKNAPVSVPDFCRIELGSFSLAASFRVARMWEIDPQIVFQANRISLLPWVTLMACPGRELEQAAARVAASRNPRTYDPHNPSVMKARSTR